LWIYSDLGRLGVVEDFTHEFADNEDDHDSLMQHI